MKKVILGSASPRRYELLSELGFEFEVYPADVDEDQITIADPGQNVLARARLKGDALSQQFGDNALILTADTTVAFDGGILNKPRDASDAWRMLQLLRGKTHQVYTGMVLIAQDGAVYERLSESQVIMRHYSDKEIEAYIASGDPMDKAGAYAIQHVGFHPVASISRCFAGIMGLALCEVSALFADVGLLNSPHILERVQKDNQTQLCHYCNARYSQNLD